MKRAALALALVLSAGRARAEEAAPVDRAEFERLRERVETLEREAAERDAAPEAPGPPEMRATWDDGVRLATEDGRFEARLGVRVDVDAAFFSAERDVERHAPNGTDVVGDFDDGARFRRARPKLSGTLFGHIVFKAEFDFANEEVEFRDVYVGARGVPVLGEALLGHWREPLGLDAMTPTPAMTFIERGLPFALTPGRNMGLGFRNAFLEKRATLSFGAFWETDDRGATEEEEMWSLTARATALPVYEDGGRRLLHLGAGYSRRFLNGGGGEIRYRSRPEAQLAEYLVETPRFEADRVDLVSGEAAAVLGPFSVQGEYVHAFNDGPGGDPEFSGWTALASLFLTGEHRGYKTAKGAFDMPEIRANFWDGTDAAGCGAWEVAARFSALDLADSREGADGGDLADVSVGVNWYWNPNFRLMANWVHAHVGGVGDADVFQTRAQLDF